MGIHQAFFMTSGAAPSGPPTMSFLYKEADGTLISSNPVSINCSGVSSLPTGYAVAMLDQSTPGAQGRYIEISATNFIGPLSYWSGIEVSNNVMYGLAKNGNYLNTVKTTSSNIIKIYTSSTYGATELRNAVLYANVSDGYGHTLSKNIAVNYQLYTDTTLSLPPMGQTLVSTVGLYSPGPAQANISLTPSGTLVYDSYSVGTGNFNIQHPTFWATPRPIVDPSAYEARVTVLSGSTAVQGTTGTWVSLANTNTWSLSTSSASLFASAYRTSSIRLEIRSASTHAILTSTDSLSFSVNLYPQPSGGGGGSGCPDPATLIYVPGDRWIAAGALSAGDYVYTMHEHTGQYGAYPITAMAIEEQEKVTISFTDSSSITVSDTHKFLLTSGKWCHVFELPTDAEIQGIKENKIVQSITPIGPGPVVRFEVADAHTYIAAGLVSHNLKLITNPNIID